MEKFPGHALILTVLGMMIVEVLWDGTVMVENYFNTKIGGESRSTQNLTHVKLSIVCPPGRHCGYDSKPSQNNGNYHIFQEKVKFFS